MSSQILTIRHLGSNPAPSKSQRDAKPLSGRPSRPRSWTKARSEPQVVDIELAYFKIAEVDFVKVVFNLFQSDVFASEDLTDEDPALMPTDIARIIHPSRLEMSRIDIRLCVAW